jgi:hypothetical protein
MAGFILPRHFYFYDICLQYTLFDGFVNKKGHAYAFIEAAIESSGSVLAAHQFLWRPFYNIDKV